MMDGNRSYIFHLKDHFFFIVLASIECSLVSCSSCFFHWLFHSFIEKVIGRINVHFPVAHQYSYTYTTFIQYGHKKNIGRINVHFPFSYQYSYNHSECTQETYRAHICTFFPPDTSIHSYGLASYYTKHFKVLFRCLNGPDGLGWGHKTDIIDSWVDMSGEGISESSESAKYKSQPFRHSCPPTLFIGRDEMLLSNWKGFVSWSTHSGCQTLKGRSKAFRKIK